MGKQKKVLAQDNEIASGVEKGGGEVEKSTGGVQRISPGVEKLTAYINGDVPE